MHPRKKPKKRFRESLSFKQAMKLYHTFNPGDRAYPNRDLGFDPSRKKAAIRGILDALEMEGTVKRFSGKYNRKSRLVSDPKKKEQEALWQVEHPFRLIVTRKGKDRTLLGSRRLIKEANTNPRSPLLQKWQGKLINAYWREVIREIDANDIATRKVKRKSIPFDKLVNYAEHEADPKRLVDFDRNVALRHGKPTPEDLELRSLIKFRMWVARRAKASLSFFQYYRSLMQARRQGKLD